MSETRAAAAPDPYLVALLEAFPMGVMAADGKGHLRAANAVMRELMEADQELAELDAGFGNAVRCIDAMPRPGGCGHAGACAGCALFQSALRAANGETVPQREARVRVRKNGSVVEKLFLVSAAPFRAEGVDTDIRALVVFQDVTDLHRLRGLISICAGCKRIQRDDKAWEQLECFIETHSHAMFSHGLCPECVGELYPQYGAAG